MTKLLLRAALPVAVGLLVLSGCDSTKSGTASPAGSATSAPSSEAPTSDAPGNASTASITDPCTLLEAADLGSYGEFKPPQNTTLGSARVCKYLKKTETASDEGMAVGVGVRDDARPDQLVDMGAGILDRDINGRPAKEAPETKTIGCTLALPVGDASRVDVLVTAVDSTEKACQVVEAVAKAVEPRLPKG